MSIGNCISNPGDAFWEVYGSYVIKYANLPDKVFHNKKFKNDNLLSQKLLNCV